MLVCNMIETLVMILKVSLVWLNYDKQGLFYKILQAVQSSRPTKRFLSKL